jgi:hypothetical protein
MYACPLLLLALIEPCNLFMHEIIGDRKSGRLEIVEPSAVAMGYW